MIQILLAIIGSSSLTSFIIFLIKRKDNKKNHYDRISDELVSLKNKSKKTEKDLLRVQLLILLKDYPEEREEILTCGERYFNQLKGNWFMTPIFIKWLKQNKIELPNWVK